MATRAAELASILAEMEKLRSRAAAADLHMLAYLLDMALCEAKEEGHRLNDEPSPDSLE